MDQSNSFFRIKAATLESVEGKKIDISKSIAGFIYFEDIQKPFVSATLSLLDSGQNLVGTLPIQGGERVVIDIIDVTKEEHRYDLRVWSVGGRIFEGSKQIYNLSLISLEALYNEGVRIYEPLAGAPEGIVSKILSEYLETEKDILVEPCKYNIKLFPEGKRAHSIINQISPKAVPKTSEVVGSDGNDSSAEIGKTSIPSDTSKLSGTSGYLFFENKNGFNFKSVDFFYSDGKDDFGGESPYENIYSVRPTNRNSASSVPEDRYIIEDYAFTSELNLFDQMRNGVFSTYCVFYNYATGAYEEYTYNLADSFENQAHLGGQTKLGKVQSDLSSRPTRIVSSILDHETWYNEPGITGSNEQRDGDGTTNQFPDFQKFYMAQSFSRYNTMDVNKLEILIPGNPELTVGTKLDIRLPNMAAQKFREEQPYDENNSGLYLISKIGHNYDTINSNVKTKLELIRDTSGMKDYDSKVK